MITSETPSKMIEIIMDTWPQIYRKFESTDKKHEESSNLWIGKDES